METPELRPLGLGELLDLAFTLYRRRFWLFVGIMAIPSSLSIPMNALLFTFRVPAPAGPGAVPGLVARGLSLYAVVIVIFLLAYAVAIGAATYAVSESYLGRSATVRDSYRRVQGRIGRILGVLFNVILRLIGVMIVVGVAFSVVAVGLAALTSIFKPRGIAAGILGVVIILIYLTMMAFFVIWSLRYAIAIPAMLLENLGVLAAIRRSIVLTRGRRRQLFVAIVLASIVAYIGVIVFQGPFFAAGVFAGRGGSTPAWMGFSSAVCGAIGGALTGPFLMIVLVLCYYDTRIRKEAFDLQFMMSSLGRPGEVPDTASPA